MENEHPKKVNYETYEHSFSYDLLKDFEEGRLRDFDTEKMRGLIYGYTFTEDYKKGYIPDALSMDYWKEKEKDRFANVSKNILHDAFSALSLSEYLGQEQLILDALMSTGDGTQENPFSVICVGHEYELLRRISPFSRMQGQRLLTGHIDCIDIEDFGQTQSVYFDISRWFEREKTVANNT
jgi:hypothetical protein